MAAPKNESGLSIQLYHELIQQICGDYLKEYGVKVRCRTMKLVNFGSDRFHPQETMIKDLKFEMRTDVISLYLVVWKNSPYIQEGNYGGIFARAALDV
jgi:hypothetical protein